VVRVSDSLRDDVLQDILEVIDEVEAEVVDECKLGATRDQIVEGTCERIRRRLRRDYRIKCDECEHGQLRVSDAIYR
jgi:hypothetical protein